MKKMILFCLFVLLSFISYSQNVLHGTAIHVYDGDTFTLLHEDGLKTKIRAVGIDAPEVKQEHGIISRDFARTLIENKKVTVYLEPGETYGRKLGIVISADGIHFNYEMVRYGHAWHYTYYNKDKYLIAVFEAAQAQNIGLWGNKNCIAPWEWRKINK